MLGLSGCLDFVTDSAQTDTPGQSRPGTVAPTESAESTGTASGTPTTDTTVSWQFGYDAANSGIAPGEVAFDSPVDQAWVFQPQNGGYPIRTSPTVVEGMVFMGSDDRRLYAIDAASGERVWSADFQYEVNSSPAATASTVYVSGYDQVFAFDRASGEPRWTQEVDRLAESAPILTDRGLVIGASEGLYLLEADSGRPTQLASPGRLDSSVPVVADGHVYLVDDAGTLSAIRLDDGGIDWTYETGVRGVTTPAVDGDRVYLGIEQWHDTGEPSVVALDRASGAVSWEVTTGRHASPPAVRNGTVYSWLRSQGGGALHAFDGSTGDVNWTVELPEVVAAPAPTESTLYVGDRAGDLHAIDRRSGDGRWTARVGGQIQATPTVANGVVYVGSDGGTLRAFSADSGDEAWAFPTMSGFSFPAPVGDTAYVGSTDSSVYALSSDSGELRWQADVGDRIETAVAIAHSTVYTTTRNGRLLALETSSGERRWRYDADDGFRAAPSVAKSTVVVGGIRGRVYAVDAESGDETWVTEVGGRPAATPAIADQSVFVATGEAGLTSLDLASGEPNWTFDPGLEFSAAPMVANGLVYAAGAEGTVHAVEMASGTSQWTFEGDSRIRWAPVVVDGTLITGLGTDLYAIDLDRGEPVWVSEGINSSLTSPPIISTETVFVGDIGNVTALNLTDGTQRWSVDLGNWAHTSLTVAPMGIFVGADGLYKFS